MSDTEMMRQLMRLMESTIPDDEEEDAPTHTAEDELKRLQRQIKPLVPTLGRVKRIEMDIYANGRITLYAVYDSPGPLDGDAMEPEFQIDLGAKNNADNSKMVMDHVNMMAIRPRWLKNANGWDKDQHRDLVRAYEKQFRAWLKAGTGLDFSDGTLHAPAHLSGDGCNMFYLYSRGTAIQPFRLVLVAMLDWYDNHGKDVDFGDVHETIVWKR